MKHHLLQLSIVAAVGATAVAGCGGDDGGGDDGGSHFTAQDVQRRFQEISGFRLVASGDGSDSTTLTLATDGLAATSARQRYGSFRITVADDDETLERQRELISSGQVLTVGNVLLRGGYGTGEDAAYRRVATILRSLGKPLSSVRLPPADTPCKQAGIDPDGGETTTGTCLDGVQTVTVVAADDPLPLGDETVSRPVVRISRTVTSRRYGTSRTFRARGRFVSVTARVENTSNAPVEQRAAALVINGRTYAPDDQQYLFQPEDRHEFQPGERGTATFLFDVPRSADDPRTGGALQFSTSNAGIGSPEQAVSVARLRLR